jgi:signal transduction histidine kinase
VVLVVSTAFRVREGEALGYLLGYEAVTNVALIATAIALGDSLRARRVQLAQQGEIARLTAFQVSREAERRVQGEREGIARDLHDLVGHTMSVISLHAGVAAEAVGRDDATTRRAVEQIRTATSQTLREMRTMVRLLRTPAADDTGRAVVSLAGVPTLVDAARKAGLTVRSEVEVDPAALSAAIDAAAFRVIQEALTNVLRHADATRADVTAEVRDGIVHVIVSDDGRGSVSEDRAGGHGLAGMAERVRLLGGTSRSGPRAAGGFLVEARLPARLET